MFQCIKEHIHFDWIQELLQHDVVIDFKTYPMQTIEETIKNSYLQPKAKKKLLVWFQQKFDFEASSKLE